MLELVRNNGFGLCSYPQLTRACAAWYLLILVCSHLFVFRLVRDGFDLYSNSSVIRFGLCSNSSVDEFEQPELSPNSSVSERVLIVLEFARNEFGLWAYPLLTRSRTRP